METKRFYSLDGLRGLCALSVLLYHSEWLLRRGVVACHGYLAVDMFFLLSGFVIARSYDGRFAAGMGPWAFLKARIRRLAPVYWAGLALCVAAALLCGMYVAGPGPGAVLVSGLKAAVLVPVLGPGTFAYPADSVAWTLGWELVVNFVYAAGLYRLRSGRMAVLAALLLAGAVLFAHINPRGWSFGMTGLDVPWAGLRAMPEFLVGVLLCRALRAGALNALPNVTPALPLLAWLAVMLLPQGLPVAVDAAAAIVLGPVLLALLIRGSQPRWMAPLGAVSYPLYASHLAWIDLAHHTPLFGLDRYPDPLRAVGMIAVALAAAWGIYRAFDPSHRKRGENPPFAGVSASRAACEARPESV